MDLVEKYLGIEEEDEEIEELLEKWGKQVKIHSTGKHADKSIEQLKKEIKAGRGKISKEKMGELLFALRSKQGWKSGRGSTGL